MAIYSTWLITASALLLLVFGLIHLLYTWRGKKFYPRDAELLEKMQKISPVISRETTMWKAWVGFNASHSFGVILFGLVYAYLALAHGAFLLSDPFLLCLGLALLIGYSFLAQLYWFSIPRRGIQISTALYVAALALSHL